MNGYYSTQIPNFVAASTPSGLRRAMFMNNKKHRSYIKYFDIQFVKGKWYAWFFIEDDESLVQAIAEGEN